MKPVKDLSFEDAYAELETIVQRLESAELTLEESVSLYERGQALHAHCQALLESAELRIQQLNADGSMTAFDE